MVTRWLALMGWSRQVCGSQASTGEAEPVG